MMDPRQMLRISQKEHPEIKDWEPGKTYKMEITCEMMNKGKDWNDQFGGTFRINTIKIVEDDKVKKLKERYRKY